MNELARPRCPRDPLTLHRFLFDAMGTACVLYLYERDRIAADSTAAAAIAEVSRIERRYSRYVPDSVLSHINRVARDGGAIDVDDETAGLLDYAFACHERSDGLFDVTSGILRRAWDFSSNRVPAQGTIDRCRPLIGLHRLTWAAPRLTFPVAGMELDFGGIGKEYAADRAAAVCASRGIAHGLVDLGGDLSVIGPHPDHRPWRINVRHPRRPDVPMATIDLDGGAIASSGDYERSVDVGGRRFSHILNPSTGWPAHGLAAVSVVADRCLVAGSFATIAMLKGRDGIEYLRALGVPHAWMDEDGRLGGTLPPFSRADQAEKLTRL